MNYQRFEELPVWNTAVKLFVGVDGIKRHPEFRFAGDLLNQLQRAALSISNNVAEGFEQGTTQQLLNFVYIARGSAGEVRSCLRVMERMPGFADLKSQISELIALAESCSRQLRSWADALQNSEIEGTRYLNDSARAEHARKERAAAFVQRLNEINRRTAETREQTAEIGNANQAAAR